MAVEVMRSDQILAIFKVQQVRFSGRLNEQRGELWLMPGFDLKIDGIIFFPELWKTLEGMGFGEGHQNSILDMFERSVQIYLIIDTKQAIGYKNLELTAEM